MINRDRQRRNVAVTGVLFDVIVKPVGVVNIFFTKLGRSQRKQVWAAELITQYNGLRRGIFVISSTIETTDNPRSVNTIPWESISIQPMEGWNKVYQLDLNDLPSVDINVNDIDLKMVGVDGSYAKYTNDQLTITQEIGYGTDSTNLRTIMSGIGVTIQK